MSDSAGLQFERAEFAKGQSPAAACRVCASELRQNYYTINGQPVCGMCCNRMRQQAERGSSLTRGLRAAGAGAAAALDAALAAGVVDQDLPHRQRRRAVKVRRPVAHDGRMIPQLQVGLVDQRRRLQGMPGRLRLKSGLRDDTQLLIHLRRQRACLAATLRLVG